MEQIYKVNVHDKEQEWVKVTWEKIEDGENW